MTNPFKYGRIFDATITRLVLALVVLLPWTVSRCHRSSTELFTQRCALIAAGTLTTDSVGGGSVNLHRGDSVTLLGVVDRSDAHRPLYWVQTDRGERGYLPQECINDSAVVVNRSISFKKDSTDFIAAHKGDTIVVKNIVMDKYNTPECTVRLASGKDTLLRGTPFVFSLADSLNYYTVRTVDENMEAMSQDRFEKLCIGKKFDVLEQELRPALLVSHLKNGTLQAQYPVIVFKGGEFFRPIVDFDADSVAVSFRLPARPAHTINNWVLKYLPFYGKFCDLPMVGAIWSSGIYENSWLPISSDAVKQFDLNGFSLKTLRDFVVFLLLIIYVICHALLVPLFVPWLLFGLLRFPIVFKHVKNKLMHTILKVLTLVLVLAWILVTLSNYYIILMVIAEFFVVNHFMSRVNRVLLSTCPETRCSLCKTLYSTIFTERVEEGERTNAIEEVEKLLDTVITSVERWQTYDQITTTYSDGSKDVSKKNVQNHSKKHGYDVYGVFMESVVYVPYTNYYTCSECGGIEKSYEKERVVVNRTKLREYQSYF